MDDRQPLRRAIRPAWSTRNFTIIMAARVAVSVARALAGVVTPIYLALEGFNAVELSEYVLVVSMASALMTAAIGLAADRVGRRPFLIGTPLLVSGAGIAFALTGAHPVLFVWGALGSFGRGAGAGSNSVGPYRPAEAALTTESVETGHRNAAFGRLTFGSSLGATVGSLVALVVPSTHLGAAAAVADFRPAFLAIAGVSGVAGVLAVLLVEKAPSDPARRRGSGRRRMSLPRRSRWLLYRLWVTNSVNGVGAGMVGPFITYWFYRRYGVGAGEIGVLYAVVNGATMVSSLSAARFARRWGLVQTVSAVRALQALVLVPMVLAPTFPLAGAAYLARMLVQRISQPLRQSYVAGLADPEERAALTALSSLPSQLAMAGSPLATGYLFEEVSLSLPFEIGAMLQVLNAGMFWAFFRHHPPEEERAAAVAAGARPVPGSP